MSDALFSYSEVKAETQGEADESAVFDPIIMMLVSIRIDPATV